MRSHLSILAFAGVVSAQTAGYNVITYPTQDSVLTYGTTINITWEVNVAFPGESFLTLLGGPTSTTLNPIENITTSIDNSAGTFPWRVDGNPSIETFGLEFTSLENSKITQFSFPFKIVPANGGDSGGGGDENDTSTTSGDGSSTTTVTSTTTTTPTTTDGWGSMSTGNEGGPAGNGESDPSHSGSATGNGDDCEPTGTGSGIWGSNGTSSGWGSCDCEGDSDNGQGSGSGSGSGSWGSSQGPWGNGSAGSTSTGTAQQAGSETTTTSPAESAVVTGAASKAVAGSFALFGGAAIALLAL